MTTLEKIKEYVERKFKELNEIEPQKFDEYTEGYLDGEFEIICTIKTIIEREGD